MENISNGIAEIFCINLKKGTGDACHKIYTERSLPLQKQWNVNLLAFGPSLHDKDSYMVIRGYKDPEDRQQSQDAFYGSDEWKQGPREAILSLIENYTTIVVPLNAPLLEGLQLIDLRANENL